MAEQKKFEEAPKGLCGTAKIEWIDERLDEIVSFIEQNDISESEYTIKLNDELMKYFIKLSQAREAEQKHIEAAEKAERDEEYRKEKDETEAERWQKEFDLKEASEARKFKIDQENIRIKEEELIQRREESKSRMIGDIAKYAIIGLTGCITAGIAGGVMIHCCHVAAGTEIAQGGGCTSGVMKKYGYLGWNDTAKFITTPKI